ncbi:MAG: hypothetical protein VCA17_15780, partial [Dehalococcoidia bacterium]
EGACQSTSGDHGHSGWMTSPWHIATGRLRKGQVRAVIDSSNPFSSACGLREEAIPVPVDA